LRYYFAGKSSPGVSDLDLSLDDFVAKVNADIVGKFVNIASRCAGFINTRFDGVLADRLPDPDAFTQFEAEFSAIQQQYLDGEIAQALRQTMALADIANRYIDEQKPWVLAKDPDQIEVLHAVCTQALNLFRILALALKPILPHCCAQAETFLNAPIGLWSDFNGPLLGHRIGVYAPLFTRIDPKHIQAMIDASTETTAKPEPDAKPVKSAEPKAKPEATGTVEMADFAKLDLRIGTVLECGFVDGSDKLLRFLLDAGELGQRQIFSGIRASYAEPEKLLGRKVVFIANLAPRKMRFGVSEGMILSAGGDDGLYLLDADAGAQAGQRVG
jgi:methionyl-tRNA synthetase